MWQHAVSNLVQFLSLGLRLLEPTLQNTAWANSFPSHRPKLLNSCSLLFSLGDEKKKVQIRQNLQRHPASPPSSTYLSAGICRVQVRLQRRRAYEMHFAMNHRTNEIIYEGSNASIAQARHCSVCSAHQLSPNKGWIWLNLLHKLHQMLFQLKKA